MPRIIDKDIDVYAAFVENHQASCCRSCVPSEERRHLALMAAAKKVLSALEDYRSVMDHGVSRWWIEWEVDGRSGSTEFVGTHYTATVFFNTYYKTAGYKLVRIARAT